MTSVDAPASGMSSGRGRRVLRAVGTTDAAVGGAKCAGCAKRGGGKLGGAKCAGCGEYCG